MILMFHYLSDCHQMIASTTARLEGCVCVGMLGPYQRMSYIGLGASRHPPPLCATLISMNNTVITRNVYFHAY